ncbi:MAG TPA: hypothetical protein VFV63_06530 [Ilumatobacteraceae bacterium]|nr:hypothetical protein [Ilumatobacteraceae bacterium]
MKRRALVMVAALALAGGACGGGDNDDNTDDATATADEADDAGDVTDEAPGTSDADDAGDVTVTGVTVDIDAVTADGGIVTDVGLIRDELMRQLVLAGMTDVQATCMADNLDMEQVAANGANDLTMFINLFETCGIDASKLTQPGP